MKNKWGDEPVTDIQLLLMRTGIEKQLSQARVAGVEVPRPKQIDNLADLSKEQLVSYATNWMLIAAYQHVLLDNLTKKEDDGNGR